MMRSSEDMAYVLYQAWHKEATPHLPLREWDDLKDWQQRGYLAQVNALLEHLFEHGRISSYINMEQLEGLRVEYQTYLAKENEQIR